MLIKMLSGLAFAFASALAWIVAQQLLAFAYFCIAARFETKVKHNFCTNCHLAAGKCKE